VRIERISTDKEFGALEREWNLLVQRSPAETVFLTWEWLSSWWSAYGGRKELFVLLARDATGECNGIAPLYLDRSRRTRLLKFIGDGTYDSDYLDFIVARGHGAQVLEAFLEYLKRSKRDWDALQLNEIPESSPTLEFLRGLRERTRWLFRQEEVPCGIRGLPARWEEFLQTLKPRFRTSVRACLRNLEQWNGGLELLTNGTEASSWLSELYELHSDRWSLRQQSGVFAKHDKRKFYEGMARSFLNRGWLHMTRWRVNGAVLACQFGFVYAGTYHLLQEGFDTRCIHASPGITLRAATIRDLISRGVHTYDFLGGIGRHKTDWGATEKKSVRLALAPPSAAGYAYISLPRSFQIVKDRAKQILPYRMIQWFKKTVGAHENPAPIVASHSPAAGAVGSKSWKEGLASALYRTGLLRLLQSVSCRYELRSSNSPIAIRWRRASTPKFVILTYHRVGSGGVPLYSALEPRVFEAQMHFLRQRYRIVSLDTLVEELADSGPAEQSVAITFDDGYRGVYTHAFPVLRKYQIPATIYLTADAIDTNTVAWYDRVFLTLSVAPGNKLDLLLERPRRFLLPTPAARLQAAEEIISYLRILPNEERKQFCIELERLVPLPDEGVTNRMLTWEQIQEMQRGGVSFGSHTLTHPAISRLDPAALEEELHNSKSRLEERLGMPVMDFAYPFGKPADYGHMSGALARYGYRTASTTNWGVNVPGVNPYELRRVSIGEERQLSVFGARLAQLFLFSQNNAEIVPAVSSAKEDAVCSSS
jgi:peptidoglycan/xylan/chitin deacetylase (PgdA/CDA1 family)/CelD/BcsL family acetyltransferase involved in cellulose biosynthesis